MRSFMILSAAVVFVVGNFGRLPVAAADKPWHATGTNGAVVAGGDEAVQIGLETLRQSGNAADAAAATILALTVTDSTQFCFGGEVAILVYDARKNRVESISGLGAAPKLATRERFITCGIPSTGVRAATVPATLDACVTLLSRYGTKTFADVAAPTIMLLERGDEKWHADLAKTLQRLIGAEKAAIGGRAEGLRAVSDYFYRGPLAAEIAAWCASNNGLIREEDLAAHKTRIVPPVSVSYRGHTVYKCGPWTQGPWLLEALALLEGFDLRAMGHNTPNAIHAQVEAMKLAMADRDVFYADPEFVDVPIDELLSPSYAALRRPLIDMQKASQEQRPGDPRAGKALLDTERTRAGLGNAGNDTTTCLVTDREGNVVAATPSGWDGVLVGDTGVWLGTRLQSFNIWEDHPNCIAPGKRPRITLTPTLVLKAGKPVAAVSVAGGDGQDQASLQLLTGILDFGLSPQQAITAPRFGTEHYVGSFRQAPPKLGSLLAENDLDEDTLKALQDRGHKISTKRPPLWAPSIMVIDRETGKIEVAGDPKAGRHAAAY